MAFDGNGQAFQDLKLIIAEWNTALGNISTLGSNQQTFLATVNESTGNTEEHSDMSDEGRSAFLDAISGDVATMDAAVAFARGSWSAFMARYISDNGSNPVGSTDFASVIRATILEMNQDTPAEDVDGSAPTIGAASYNLNNQGNGTAAIAVNSDATLRELLLAGKIILRCTSAGFNRQNAERWQLIWEGTDPRSLKTIRRFSPSVDFTTGVEYTDVVSLVEDVYQDELQVPQSGGSIHTGLVITVSAPNNYDDSSESGDVDTVFSGYSVQKKVGTKSNLTRRNSTYAYNASRSGTIYLEVIKDGTDYHCTWYADSGYNTALTESKTFTTATTGVQNWLVAATNPEHTSNGGFLETTDTFISATVTGATFTQSADISVAFPLPFDVGDEIYATASNSYAGVIERFFVQELGIALPPDTGGTETITDP